MTARQRNEARALYRDGVSPWKIGLYLGVADAVIRYVVDHRGEKAKVKARVYARRAALKQNPRQFPDGGLLPSRESSAIKGGVGELAAPEA